MNLHPQAAESLLAAMRASLSTALFAERIGDYVRVRVCVQAAAVQLERALSLETV